MSDPDPQALKQWTLYDRSPEYPDHYMARLFLIHKGSVEATGTIRLSKHPQSLRIELFEHGFVRMSRSPDDDPLIMETWL